jgi:hypothetical protein
MTPRIQPITRSIAAIRKQISDAEWNGDTAAADALRPRLASLQLMQARGEQWDVPF